MIALMSFSAQVATGPGLDYLRKHIDEFIVFNMTQISANGKHLKLFLGDIKQAT